MHYCIMAGYRLVQVSVLCLPHPSPCPSPSTIPAATGEYHIWDGGGKVQGTFRQQHTVHTTHLSFASKRQPWKHFLILSRTHYHHCHVVLCLKADTSIPDLPLAIHFALTDHFRALIFPNKQPCKWKTTQMCS